LEPELIKRAKVKGLVGGQTTSQGANPRPEIDLLGRNAESMNFGRQKVQSRVPPIGNLAGTPLATLISQMRNGQVDAWLVHLAEGVRDSHRRPGDATSSRAEFTTLKDKGCSSRW